MSDQRTLRIMNLKERIDRDHYHVDVGRVAEAILGRPIARMLIIPGETLGVEEGAESAGEADREPPSSEDVLEAA
jgi:hypothetical protein